jgi:DNA-binding beta-propeller fold protein YncE
LRIGVIMVNVSYIESPDQADLPSDPESGRRVRRGRAWYWLVPTCTVIAVAITISVVKIHAFLYGDTPILRVGVSPYALVVSPDGRIIYLADSTDTITPVSAVTGKSGRSISIHRGSLGPNPNLAITPDGRNLFAATYDASGSPLALACIDLQKGQETAQLQPSGGVVRFVMSKNGKILYVLNEHSAIIAVNVINCRVEQQVRVSQGLLDNVTAMLLSPNGETLYVAAYSNNGSNYTGTVTPINLRTGVASQVLSVGWQPTSLAITPDGHTLYTSVDGLDEPDVQVGPNRIVIINTVTGEVRGKLSWQVPPIYLQMAPSGKTVWVVSSFGVSGTTADNTLTPVDVTSSQSGPSFHVSGWLNSHQDEPSAVAISPDCRTLYVTVPSGLETFHTPLSCLHATEVVSSFCRAVRTRPGLEQDRPSAWPASGKDRWYKPMVTGGGRREGRALTLIAPLEKVSIRA